MRAGGLAGCFSGCCVMLVEVATFPPAEALAAPLMSAVVLLAALLVSLAGEGVSGDAAFIMLLSGRANGTGAASCNCSPSRKQLLGESESSTEQAVASPLYPDSQ